MTYNRFIIFLCSILFCIPLFSQSNSADSTTNSLLNTLPTTWGKTDYDGLPWTKNVSRPHQVTRGLQNRHLVVWQSHGKYYDAAKQQWKWQRPALFGTREDLFTQTIVIPYLVPMLENAGAVVYTVRERDWQKHEVIVDNNYSTAGTYREQTNGKKWKNTSMRGFAYHATPYVNGENPFTAGTARQVKAVKNGKKESVIIYQPTIPEEGDYAVYVSYQTQKKSIPDACYLVFHQGISTEVRVNQKMGGGTWVYLGTYHFDKGSSADNCVVLSNLSSYKGVVTADAVRFGGGMGNIARGGQTSGMPRSLEGARYAAQWAGAPDSIYNGKQGENDYADDINSRSNMLNWLGGGSVYMPTRTGQGVPFELSLAVHSDAGYKTDGSLVGSLAICTTDFHNGALSGGLSRNASKKFANALLNNLNSDMRQLFGRWNKRYLWDRNYSETRLPEVPSAIIETLSHQNFYDMQIAQQPQAKFAIARSLYKTILQFVSNAHGKSYVVQPLQPVNFRIESVADGKAKLKWNAQRDPLDASATPTSYNIYVRAQGKGFDNGTNISTNGCTIDLKPDVKYDFRVTAVNAGGESFPSPTLSALWHANTSPSVMIVNAFDRLDAPAVIETDSLLGFDLNTDIGVSYGLTAGWNGAQTDFDKSKAGGEGAGALGFGGDELAGQFIMGNDFCDIVRHADALQTANAYNIVSCTSDAIEQNLVTLANYNAVDVIFGLQKNISSTLKNNLIHYLNNGGRMLCSGSYVGSVSLPFSDAFQQTLQIAQAVTDSTASSTMQGLGCEFSIQRNLNDKHYAAQQMQLLQPTAAAFCAMQNQYNNCTAVAYDGNDYRTFTMSFPFACITDAQQRAMLMRGIMKFLTK